MENKKAIKIILDTDIGGDCDDAGTLAMLHRLCDRGEAELLAVTHCFASPYVAGCIDAINQFYGREVPIGINYSKKTIERGVYAGELCDHYVTRYPAEYYMTPRSAPDTLTVLRKTLAEAEDGSVTLVVTGNLASMAKLVRSGADELSPLTGKELIAQKIIRTVVMGGRFFESWPMTIYPDGNASGNPVTWEWNIKGSGLCDAQTACDEWPGELVFSSYEIGSYIKTMVGYPDRAEKGNPVALAYQIHNHGKGRCSWDQTAMLEAIRPNTYWNYHEFGRITVDDAFVTHWCSDPSRRHTYLLPKIDYEEIRRVIDDLVDEKNPYGKACG
ncbi:MAG: nucleoside hydrolase [Clostridia bacterium]|nr:nucleoside hydrolase [Clostridia bacterium]